jgi:hypothetical protein
VTLDELRELKVATITREQAASILNVDPRLVSKGISSGVIPSIKIDRKALVLREPLVRLLTGDPGGGTFV